MFYDLSFRKNVFRTANTKAGKRKVKFENMKLAKNLK